MRSELQILYKTLGSETLKRRDLKAAPAWLLDNAGNEELSANWKGAYQGIFEANVQRGSNVIGSHIIYKIKSEEHGKRLKVRLCPHGSRDKEKDGIFIDLSTAQLDVTSLIASITACSDLTLACIDIKKHIYKVAPSRASYMLDLRKSTMVLVEFYGSWSSFCMELLKLGASGRLFLKNGYLLPSYSAYVV